MFGDSKSLIGIVTDPSGGATHAVRPAALFLNAGLTYRVGPNRLYVKIARALGADGFISLRFDLSGIGDSRARDDEVSLDRRAIVEAREAMDSLALTRGAERFLSLGLCSGADDSLRVACAEPRVAGVVLIDSYHTASLGFRVGEYLPRLLSPRSWIQLLTGQSSLWKTLSNRLLPRLVSNRTIPGDDWKLISKDELVSGVSQLVDRGTEVLLVYTQGPAYYQYRKHLKSRLEPLLNSGKLRIEVFPDSDHVFTRLADQQGLIRLIRDWAGKLA